ncbi:condensation domain-containing protein [Kitasatospora sp. NPDC048538]|uniref:condensation domain-containing protein n=1 Tax=Kitasatospora sp. NPDC048538 TaxID=3155633 RepID=UPI0033D27837
MAQDVSAQLADLTPDQRELLRLRLAGRERRPERLPLSFTQEQLWFLDRMDPGTAVYNVPFALELDGPLDRDALAAALNAVVARQEALRLVFAEDDDGPHQYVLPAAEVPLPVVDLRGLPAEERAARADRTAAEHGLVAFDLTRGPQLAACLLALADDRHRLLVTVHHIVYDAWSGDVFATELVEHYRRFAEGTPVDLPVLRTGFADHARGQREPAALAALEEHLAYWRERLADAPLTSTPRPDRRRPPVQTHRGGRHVRAFPAELTAAMTALAREAGVTFNAVALAGFGAALSQHTGHRDLVLGTPAAGRPRVELEPLIGSFANMLVLRIDLSGDPSVREAVRRAHRTTGEAYRHQDVPYARVVEEVAPPRDPGINPLFQVLFTVTDAGAAELSAAGVRFSPLPVDNRLTDFDLFVTLSRRAGRDELVVDYNADLYLAGTVERLAERVAAVLADMVRAADEPLHALPSTARATVAVGATFTADLIADPLRLWLDLRQAPADVRLAPYGQLVQHLLTPDDAAVTVGLLRWEDWLRRSAGDADPAAVLDAAMRDFEAAVAGYRRRTGAPLVLLRCPASPAAAERGWSGLFARLDDRLAALRHAVPGVSVDWVEEHPYPVPHDPVTDRIGHIPYPPEYFAALAGLVARRLPAPEPEPERAACAAALLDDPAEAAARVAPRAVRAGDGAAPGREPGTPTEVRLAQIWREVLRVAEVGADSDFFALGGHSLLATQLLSRLRREFGREVSLYSLFTHPTLAGLGAVLDAAEGAAAEALEPAPPGAQPVASSIQQRLWATSRLDSEDARHNTMSAMTLHGPLDVAALERAVEEVVRRHEALRTTFTEHRGLPVPVVHPRLPVWCEPVDLTGPAGGDRERAVAERIERLAAHPYSLADGPLVRVELLRTAPEEHRLLIGMHHIVCDSTSWGILLDELSVLYGAYTAGRPSPLPEPVLQFGDFAHDQQRWLAGPEVETHTAFWRERLRGAPAPVELPGDVPPGAAGTGAAGTGAAGADGTEEGVAGRAGRLFPAELGTAVRDLARAEGVTPYSVLLTVFAVLLQRESGRSDLVIGMPTTGRDRAELQGVVGCFADLLPLRLDLSGDPAFRRLVRRLHAGVKDAQAHQRLPFPKIMEALRLPRDSSRHPLRCVLNYADAPDEPPTLPGLTVEPLPAGPAGADFDVLFTVDWQGDRLEADFTYSAELFSHGRAEAVVARFGELLADLVAAPDTVIATDRQPAADRPVQRIGVASSFPTGELGATLGFWSGLLGEPALEVSAAPPGQVRRPLLDPDGPFRANGLDVLLLRWEDLLPGTPARPDGAPALPAGVAALERALAELAAAVGAHRDRTDGELVLGLCPASAAYADDRWAGVFGGLSDRLTAFAATLPGVHVLTMDRWARRYGLGAPHPGRDGLPYSAAFETVLGTVVARLAGRQRHRPVDTVAADPCAFGPELVPLLREQLGHGREVVLTAPPSLPELDALVAVGAVRVGGAPEGAVLLDPAVAPAHLWPLDAPFPGPSGRPSQRLSPGLGQGPSQGLTPGLAQGPSGGPSPLPPLPPELLADIATGLATAEDVADAVRTGARRPARRTAAAPRTERERALAAIWAEVLHLGEVGIHDDFYELGGDSLLAITVAFHAAEAGIRLSARQLTERRTIAELDLDAAAPTTGHEVAEGEVPLTPAQLWWFESVATTMAEPSWFNHPYYLDLLRPVAVEHLREAVRLLADHHGSLRLRFRRTEDGTLRQHHADPADAVPFASHDLSAAAPSEQDEAMLALAAAAQRTLDLTEGPTCRVLHFATGPDRPDRLLIIAHHLVVDAISRDLLLGDLRTLCTRLANGEPPRLPARTTAYSTWARRLSAHDLSGELPHWLAQTSAAATLPPPDHPDGVTTLAAGAMTSTTLTTEQTDGLHEAVRRLRVNVRDLLVWSVAEAAAARAGTDECLLATTGHGREHLFADVDLNRTTGWFQVMYPALLRLPETADPGARAAAVARQLARVPNNGIGYGVLRFAGPDREVRARLAALVQPRIAVNYMGNFGFDEVARADDLFEVCDAPYGETDDGVGRWPYDLDVGGVIVGGRLRLDVGYATTVYAAGTAREFLDELRARLVGLIGPTG